MKRNVFGDSSSDSEHDPAPVKKPRKLLVSQNGAEEGCPEDTDYKDFQVEDSSSLQSSDDEEHKASLDKPIFGSSSIGLSLMEKMGFKVGQSLGASGQGISEPVPIVKRRGREGLRETKTEVVPEINADSIENYVSKSSDKHEISRSTHMVEKLQRFCFYASGDDEKLEDGKLKPAEVNVFWRSFSREKLSQKPARHRQVLLDGEAKTESPSEPEPDMEEWLGLTVHEQLAMLIKYTRSTFFYCCYCQIQFSNAKDLELGCPGPSLRDHDL